MSGRLSLWNSVLVAIVPLAHRVPLPLDSCVVVVAASLAFRLRRAGNFVDVVVSRSPWRVVVIIVVII